MTPYPSFVCVSVCYKLYLWSINVCVCAYTVSLSLTCLNSYHLYMQNHFLFSHSLSLSHTLKHTHTHTLKHTHKHTHTHFFSLSVSKSFPIFFFFVVPPSLNSYLHQSFVHRRCGWCNKPKSFLVSFSFFCTLKKTFVLHLIHIPI
jgi:hypothetical protein